MAPHQEKPKSQFDHVVVCIGVPVADSHPVAPPPPPAAASGGATHNNFDSKSYDTSEDKDNCDRCMDIYRFILLIISLCAVLSFIVLVLTQRHPSFKVESISVALDKTDISNNQSEAIRAAWDVGFSIKNPGKEISVSIRCMSSNWSAITIEGISFRKTTFVDAVVIMLLPREFVLPELMVRGLTLQYDVLLGTNEEEGVCKNMTVVFSLNATRGIMLGGQRSCHKVVDN